MRARDMASRLAVGAVAAALLAGALLWFYLVVLLPEPVATRSDLESGPWDELAAAAVIAPVGYYLVRRRATSLLVGVEEGRPLTAEQQRAVLALPRTLGRNAALAWVMIGLGAVVVNQFFGRSEASMESHLTVFLALALGGFIHSAALFLLAERTLRPVFSVVLGGEVPRLPTSVGARPRLLLAWVLGSGVPFVAIGLAFVGRSAAERAELGPAVAFLVVIGVLGGGLLVAVTARTVTEPIDGMRAALSRVEGGDLDASVLVEDGGEVGYLQAGFNRMVAGLRERQQLADLFGRHVGEEVAQRALAGGVVLGGEQREASVLFVDLVGSTGLAQQRPPTEVVVLLNRFFAAVVTAVKAEGGWVNKFEGDAALCVFGAPEDQLDHAGRALRAARSLRAAVDALGLEVGIGVSTGPVVAGNVGAEERYEYTVIGDPVNEAARLTEAAKAIAGLVLASSASVEAADKDERCRWTSAGEVHLRGRAAATSTFAPTR